jgi:hypothetical protein
MDKHFLNGGFIFFDPAYQFNEPKLPSKIILGVKIQKLYSLSKNKSPITIQIKDIALPDVPCKEHRLKNADTSFPIWVIEGIKNPEDEKYLLIDGKHRVHILNNDSIQAIVFSVKEVRPALEVLPKWRYFQSVSPHKSPLSIK